MMLFFAGLILGFLLAVFLIAGWLLHNVKTWQ